MKKLFAFFTLILFSYFSFAQLETEDTETGPYTPEELISDILLGSGVILTSLEYQVDEIAVGNFRGGMESIGIDSGIIMTTGRCVTDGAMIGAEEEGSEFASSILSDEGMDVDISAIIDPFGARDIQVFKFSFIPLDDSISFDYVWASEEYPEYVCSNFNDAFGFFLSGPGISGPYENDGINLAMIPNSEFPVAINTVNSGEVGDFGQGINCEPPNGSLDFSEYYVDNDGSDNQPVYDGLTTVLMASAKVIPCEEYTIKLVIADAGDQSFDSGVFIRANSFASAGTAGYQVLYPIGDAAYEECNEEICVDVFIINEIDSVLVIPVSVDESSTADEDDHGVIPESIVFEPGVDTVTFCIDIVADQIAEGPEQLILTLDNFNICGDSSTMITINIDEPEAMEISVAGPDTVCAGEVINISSEVMGGVGDLEYDWSTGDNDENISVMIEMDTEYSLIVMDECGQSDTSSLFVVALQEIEGMIIADSFACPGDTVTLSLELTGEVESILWNTGEMTETITVVLDNEFEFWAQIEGCDAEITLFWTFDDSQCCDPIDGAIIADSAACAGDEVTLIADFTGAVDSYEWSTGDTSSSISIVLDTVFTYSVSVTGCAEVLIVLTWTFDISNCCEDPVIHFSLDDCLASSGETAIYEEFQPSYLCDLDCADLESTIIFREPSTQYRHSCTPGFSEAAMCVSALEDCDYQGGHNASIVFEVTVDPVEGTAVNIEELKFYEKAPEEFEWINGSDGINNYPTLYGLRILIDDVVWNEYSDLPTTLNWTLESFSFEDLQIDGPSVLRFELLSYCLIGNGESVRAWDIDELSLVASCEALGDFSGFVSGAVSYDDADISGVDVVLRDLENANTWIDQSAENGQYAFNSIPFFENYRVVPISPDNYTDGLSTLDLVIIQRHLLGRKPFDSPYDFIAADADDSHTIGAYDIVLLKRLLLGMDDKLANADAWEFVESSAEIDMSNPYNYSGAHILENLEQNSSTNDFEAVKVGDLNRSADAYLSGNIDSRSTFSIDVSSNASEQKEFLISQSAKVQGLQLCLAGVSSVSSDLPGFDENSYRFEDGLLYIAYVAPHELFLDAGETLFLFKTSSTIEIVKNDSFQSEIYFEEEMRQLVLRSNSIIGTEDLEVVVYPNPSEAELSLEILNKLDGEVKIVVFNTSGQTVFAKKVLLNNENYKIQLNKFDLGPSGIYSYHVYSSEMAKSGQIIILD